jgi:hypothetical protein
MEINVKKKNLGFENLEATITITDYDTSKRQLHNVDYFNYL